MLPDDSIWDIDLDKVIRNTLLLVHYNCEVTDNSDDNTKERGDCDKSTGLQ